LRACYEAGPTGYVLYRQLNAAFVGRLILLQPSDGVWISAVGTPGSVPTFNVSGAGTGSGQGTFPVSNDPSGGI
jgi:hypothetical protein